MRTKTILLTAALSVATVATSMADVFSVNVVGYVNKTLPPGFSIIANPLQTTNNTLNSLIPNAVPGDQVFQFTGAGYTSSTFDEFDLVWIPNLTLDPGEGVFYRNSQATNQTATFVGEVIQGETSNPLPAGFSIKSSIVPQSGTLSALGVPGQPGDQIFKFTGAGYTSSTFDEFDLVWIPDLVINVAEGVFVRKNASDNWVRTFNVE